MKNIIKRAAALLLAVLVLSASAFAASLILTEEPVKLTIHCEADEKALSGVTFELFRVADVDARCNFTLTEAFAACPVDLSPKDTAEGWDGIAEVVKGFVLSNSVTAIASGKTNEDGDLVLEGLQTGLYLLTGTSVRQGSYVYTPDAAMIALPVIGQETADWTYDVTVEPKFSSTSYNPGGGHSSKVTVKVLKVWDDGEDADRPRSVTMKLLRNGEKYDSVVLDEGSDWRHTWNNLSEYTGSKRNDWTVVEVPVDGYTVQMERSGVTLTVTNTAKEQEKPVLPEELPSTGQLWWPAPVLLSLGLVCVLIGLLRRRKQA